MKKQKINKEDNFLEFIPIRNSLINWSVDDNGLVTLEIENKGAFNRMAQKLFKKPKISYVHLDENGSFIWPLIDGVSDVLAISERVKEHFGEKAEPLYPRLVKFMQILESYRFIELKKNQK